MSSKPKAKATKSVSKVKEKRKAEPKKKDAAKKAPIHAARPRLAPPTAPMPVASVNARSQGDMILRTGRGFSIAEVSEAEVPMTLAKSWNLSLDVRRRSAHEPNVTSLKKWFSTAKAIEPKESKVEVEAEEEKPSTKKRQPRKRTPAAKKEQQEEG